MTGHVYDDIFLAHGSDQHPEGPARLKVIREHLVKVGLWDRLEHIPARPATMDELTRVHSPKYVKSIEEFCEAGGGTADVDTVLSRESYRAAIMAAGGCIEAGEAVVAGRIRNAFCAVRPPGHHALADRTMGFCIFNNIAILAKALQYHRDIVNMLIIDWDIHHGNGTQEAFYDDPTVFFFSLHGFPMFPGSGARNESGSGLGRELTVNIPIFPGTDRETYLRIFQTNLADIRERFKPDLILISAGFDTYKADPVGGLGLEIPDFGLLTQWVVELANEACKGRIVSVLEGGYDLTALPLSVEAHLRALAAM
ncbi:MAG TPA: histone deacetylase [Planctomycetota bacterium]|nr:histone deacetylase [Planctomycetota bacterium]